MTINTRVTVVLGLADGPDSVEGKIFQRNSNPALQVADMIYAIHRGIEKGRVLIMQDEADATAATNTAKFSYGDGADGDTVTVCGVVFTARTSPSADPVNGEFALSTDDDTTSAAFAAAVNAHPRMRNLMSAASSTDTTTLTMQLGGAYANFGTLSTSNATFCTVGGANFSSGAEDGTLQHNLIVDVNANNN